MAELMELSFDHLEHNIDLCLNEDPLVHFFIKLGLLVENRDAEGSVGPVDLALERDSHVRLHASLCVCQRWSHRLSYVLNLRLNFNLSSLFHCRVHAYHRFITTGLGSNLRRSHHRAEMQLIVPSAVEVENLTVLPDDGHGRHIVALSENRLHRLLFHRTIRLILHLVLREHSFLLFYDHLAALRTVVA